MFVGDSPWRPAGRVLCKGTSTHELVDHQLPHGIDKFMVQFGCPHSKDPNSPRAGTGDAPAAASRTSTCRTRRSPNARGTLSMANTGPNSGSCQFFINVVDNTYLDWFSPGQSKHPVFGKVIDGMDVVDAISKAPRGAGRSPEDADQDEQDHRLRRLMPTAERWARAHAAPRTLVIGDVHGCLDELRALLGAAGRTPTIASCSSAIWWRRAPTRRASSRGRANRSADAVLGNHDDHVLRRAHGERHVGAHHRAVAEA